ncbi:MAG TPA: hypothetical protein VMX54_00635, partial [Vicinamibacteria bacterium]|nr:hypothetical protein [Vicinamibacteria bacterium]
MRGNQQGGGAFGRAVFVLGLAFLLVPAAPRAARAQGAPERAAAALSEMAAAAGGRVESRRSALTGTARFVRSKAGIAVEDRGTPLGRAHAFLDAHGAAFGLRDATQVRPLRAPERDRLGIDHVRLQQVVNEVPVVGGELLVHLRGSRVVSAQAKTLPDLDGFDTRAQIPAVTAADIARRFCETELQATEVQLSEPRLEILNKGIFDGRKYPTLLVWFVEATGPALRESVWVEAQHGTIALHFSQLGRAMPRQVYTAGSSNDVPGLIIGTEWVPPAGDADATAAYDFAGDAYDYFWTEQGRDGYSDKNDFLRLT